MFTSVKNPFKSKIRCRHCGKNYRSLSEKGVKKFICGGYHNKNGCSKRVVIKEDFIRDLINRRYDGNLTNEELIEILDYVEIEDKFLMEIHFTDRSKPILLKGNFVQF